MEENSIPFLNKNNIKDALLSILLVSGEGVQVSDVASKLNLTEDDVYRAVDELSVFFGKDFGLQIIKFNGSIQLSSNPKYADYISAVLNPIREKALTKATLETLAIIAYKQPITRLEIEEVRGVSSDYAVSALIEQNLIEIIGRKDVIGKPLLYSTTDKFLKKFSLHDLSELPDQETILESLKLIHGDEKSDSLYFDFKLSDEQQIANELDNETPDFLNGENYIKVDGE